MLNDQMSTDTWNFQISNVIFQMWHQGVESNKGAFFWAYFSRSLTHILKEQNVGFILTIHVKVIWPTFTLCPSPEKYQNPGFRYLFPEKNCSRRWGEKLLMQDWRVVSGGLKTGLKICGTARSGGARELRRWSKSPNFENFPELTVYF